MDIACRRRSETQKKYWDSHDRHTGPIPTASIASWGGADSPFCYSPLGSRGELAGREGPPPASEGEGLGTDLAPTPPDASGGRSVNLLSATWGSYGFSHTYTDRDSVAGGERDLEMAEFRVRHVPARVRTGFRESASANAAAEDCFSFGVRGSRLRMRAGTQGDLCAVCPPC